MSISSWNTATTALRCATRIVVFSGAGMSAESGIPTFRDADGFWQRFPPEQFATWKGLLSKAVTNPRQVAEFVLNVVEPIAMAQPNAGHAAVAQLEQWANVSVATQNIDGLHQSAGSTYVNEIHGSIQQVVNVSTGKLIHEMPRSDLAQIAHSLRDYVSRETSVVNLAFALPKYFPFDWFGRHRPNLILFGDSLAQPAWQNAIDAVSKCDVLISIGTSGVVYPAAALPDRAELSGATIISIDPQPAPGCWLEGRAGTVLPALIADAFESGNS